MSSPITPNPMLAAQVISYAKGQENQTRFSGEKQERERKDNIQGQLAKNHRQDQEQAPGLKNGNGILA
jgi:hypothetical protein